MSWLTMEDLVDGDILPLEAAKAMNWLCPYCGWAIVTSENLRHRTCSNKHCPELLAQRASDLFTELKYKGIGSSTLRTFIRRYGMKSHFDTLNPEYYKNQMSHKESLLYEYASMPRKLPLYKIAELAAIPGLKDKCFELFKSYASFTEFYEQNPNTLLEYKELLISAEQYFEIERPLSSESIEIMITQSLKGYENKEVFVRALNSLWGDKLAVKFCRHLKKSVDYVVCDVPGCNSKKIQTARRCGIPVLTSDELLQAFYLKFGDPTKEENN